MSNNKLHQGIDFMKKGLEADVTKVVLDSFIKDKLEEFEQELREVLAPSVAKLSIESIEAFADYMEMAEKVHVYIHGDSGLIDSNVGDK